MRLPSFKRFVLTILFISIHSISLLLIQRNVRNRKCSGDCSHRLAMRSLKQHETSGQVDDKEEFHGTTFSGFDANAITEFKAALEKRTKLRQYLFVTKNNTRLGEKFKCLETDEWVIDPGWVRISNRTFYSKLPKESPLKGLKNFATCSVVGSAGLLKNSYCGREIDSSSFVFRSNFPPIGGEFQNDVGKKTDFLTANPSIFSNFYNNLRKSTHKKAMAKGLHEYGEAILWTHPFHLKKYTDLTLRAYDTVRMFNMPNKVLFSHPKFLKNLTAFWKEQGLRAPRPSTGLALTAVAAALCDQVTMYGFWPFPYYRGRALSYHYYDRAVIGTLQFKNKTLEYQLLTQFHPFHNFTEEFEILEKMQGKGILKVQVGECGNK